MTSYTMHAAPHQRANMTECSSAGEHHVGNGVCEPEQTWSCPALRIEGSGKTSIAGEAFIGTKTKITCSDKWWLDVRTYFLNNSNLCAHMHAHVCMCVYVCVCVRVRVCVCVCPTRAELTPVRDFNDVIHSYMSKGETELECIGASGDDSSTGAHWGLASTGDAHISTCKQCKDECATCSDGGTCITCKDAAQIFAPSQNKCIVNKAKSCKQLLDWGELDLPKRPKTRHTVQAILYPDVAKDPTRKVRAYCHVTVEKTVDGKDRVSAFTSIMCSELEGSDQFGKNPCKLIRTIEDTSSCDDDGYIPGS